MNAWKVLCLVLLAVLFIFLYNEWIIYYVYVYLGCSWPNLLNNNDAATRIMIAADTHILGRFRGHWFDKLRREWQMYRAFQTAITVMKPQAVFFLGDLFDEGTSGNISILASYAQRFDNLFHVPDTISKYVILGNHDIGFHNEIWPPRLEFLSKRYQLGLADHILLGGNHFVLLNSMALERDGCPLCTAAENEIERLSRMFSCVENSSDSYCSQDSEIPFSRPIVMQHFPFYRKNDYLCVDDYDAAPEPLKSAKFHEGLDCLSKNATEYVLSKLKPRAVFDGHTHYGCQTWWSTYSLWEWTVASLSWRNNHQPVILFVAVTPVELVVPHRPEIEIEFRKNAHSKIALRSLIRCINARMNFFIFYVSIQGYKNILIEKSKDLRTFIYEA